MGRRDEWDDGEYNDRPRQAKAWGPAVVVVMVVLTILIPILGIVLGIIDMSSPGPRRGQGAAFLAVGLVMMVIYALALVG